MEIKTFFPPKRVLMGPGPSDIHPRVLEALSRPTIGHLDPMFIKMMDEVKELLKYTFQTENEVTFPLSAPGSAGMEMTLLNLVEPNDKVIVCVNGVFGGRMKSIVERAGGIPIVIEDEWGRAIDPEKVESTLKVNNDIKVLAFVHAETSTGALSDAEVISKIAHKYGAIVVADTVTSLGGSKLLVDEWELDAVYSGSQKCLSCPPGLSPVTFNERALEIIKRRKTSVRSWFMDLNLMLGYWGSGSKRTYHHTAPINSLYGLHEALLMVKEEGIKNAWERHINNSAKLIAGLSELGLEPIVPESERLPQLLSISIPSGINDTDVRNKLLNEYNLEIGAGLGNLAGKVWRIGLMGYSSREENISLFLKAMANI